MREKVAFAKNLLGDEIANALNALGRIDDRAETTFTECAEVAADDVFAAVTGL